MTRRVAGALLDAVLSTLEAEAAEEDIEKRLVILSATRTIIEGWRQGRMTTAEAVHALRVLRGPPG
ncbi:MAG: hypothetical protein ACLP1X_29930 [Polyangiaceae bacterium]